MQYLIHKVKNFEKHKKNIIDLIYQIPLHSFENETQKITHTDWGLAKQNTGFYKKYIVDNFFSDFGKDLANSITLEHLSVSNMWFQVYRKGDFHNYHTHPKANLANVFYINLPNKSMKTNFKNDILNVDVEEGDILTFPAFLVHASPINTFNEEKIVISFNTDLHFDQRASK